MATRPDFRAARFDRGAPIDNPYFPLTAGSVLSYGGSQEDPDTGEVQTENNDLFVSFETKKIQKVQTVVVRDTAYADGALVEDTLDWYAQDTDGNVWYFGEIAYNYRYDDEGHYTGTDNDGSWQAGTRGAKPGWIMKADPAVGESYFQEFAPGIAEDEAAVVAAGEQVSIDFGDFDDVLKTLDTSGLEPTAREFKYYAPGVGQILGEEGISDTAPPEFVAELLGIRDLAQPDDDAGDDDGIDFALNALADGVPLEGIEDAEGPGFEDLRSDDGSLRVTVIGGNTDLNNAIGAYSVSARGGRIGEGRILFDALDEISAGESVEVAIRKGQALGLFCVADGGELGIDLSPFEEGGLSFRNMLTGRPATINDGLAPLVANTAKDALPIQPLHLLGNDDGFNVLNPVAGVHGVELDSDAIGEDDDILLIGFEDRRVVSDEHDGDFDDLVIAVSDEALSDELVAELEQELAGAASSDALLT